MPLGTPYLEPTVIRPIAYKRPTYPNNRGLTRDFGIDPPAYTEGPTMVFRNKKDQRRLLGTDSIKNVVGNVQFFPQYPAGKIAPVTLEEILARR